MNCKDLTIGDFVKHDGTIKIVDAVYLYSVSVHDPSEEWSISEAKTYSIDDIEPIKLTEEILVKNGYKSAQGVDFYWIDEKKHCSIKNYDGKRLFCYKQGINDVWLVVKYVHELQHLLRLCGIEKEIEL